MHQRCRVIVDERFQRNIEFAAIAKQKFMMIRDSRRTNIEIQVVIKIEQAGLRRTRFGHHITCTNGLVTPARNSRRLKYATPALAGQSPGRGDGMAAGGLGGGFGLPGIAGAADEEPQLASDVPIPIAAIVFNMAELPTARPIDVKKSRRAIRFCFAFICSCLICCK
jgi:hypothetical protein